MEFDANYRFMEYLFCSIFLFIFFWVITIFVSLVALHLKYLKDLKKKQLEPAPVRYFRFVKNKFTKRNVLTVVVLIPLCLAGISLALISIRAHYRADILRFELRNTSMLRIRDGGLCHRYPGGEKELYKTKDKGEIKDFLAKISFEPSIIGAVCACCGDMTFEFYDNDKLLNTCSFHHGSSMRFPYSLGDCELTPRSQELLRTWLYERIEKKKNSAKND
jgi:hypothetical protein